MKRRLMLYPCACFPLPREISDVLATWGGYASMWCSLPFSLRSEMLGSCAWCWAVCKKQAATSLPPYLFSLVLMGSFFQDLKRKKGFSLWRSKATRVYIIYTYIYTYTHTHTIQQKLPQLFGKKDYDLLCQFWSCISELWWQWFHFIDLHWISEKQRNSF